MLINASAFCSEIILIAIIFFVFIGDLAFDKIIETNSDSFYFFGNIGFIFIVILGIFLIILLTIYFISATMSKLLRFLYIV